MGRRRIAAAVRREKIDRSMSIARISECGRRSFYSAEMLQRGSVDSTIGGIQRRRRRSTAFRHEIDAVCVEKIAVRCGGIFNANGRR